MKVNWWMYGAQRDLLVIPRMKARILIKRKPLRHIERSCKQGSHEWRLLTLLSSPAGKNFRVGKLCTLTASISLAVESILATMVSALSLYFSPSFSQMGVSCLQCPHQGASRASQMTQKHHQCLITDIIQRLVLHCSQILNGISFHVLHFWFNKYARQFLHNWYQRDSAVIYKR